MAVKVVDASALAALLFGEPEADAIAVRLDGVRLAAPALLGHELANARPIKGRRHPEQRDALLAAFRLRDRLGVETATVDHDAVPELADATGLTARDASRLWLARQLGAALITLDQQLARVQEASRPWASRACLPRDGLRGGPDDAFPLGLQAVRRG